MNNDIPKVITDVGFDFDWDEKDVWKLDYPSEEINIDLLSWHFEIPFWDEGGKSYVLKPIEVCNNKEHHAQEYDRTMMSDISCPIDIMENKGRYVILDGLHRLLKYKILGYEKCCVRIIPREEIPNISHE